MKITKMISFFVLAIALQGCASAQLEKKVDQTVASSAGVQSRATLNDEATQMIQNAPGLSDEQRSALTALQATARSESMEINQESLRLRAALIKTVFTPDYNAKEVAIIKKRMKKVEEKRLSVTFSAIDKANKILGREAKNNPELMSKFFERGREN